MKANYILAVSGGYKLEIKDEGYNPYDPNVLSDKNSFRDAAISKDDILVDMYDLHQYGLVTVNGYIHPTSYTDGELFIKEATTNMLRSKCNMVGIISFFDCVDKPLDIIHISEDMISKDGDFSLYEKALITIDKELDGVILSMAGYLIFEDGVRLSRVGDKTFSLKLNKLNYLDRIYELNKHYDIFKELEVEVSPLNNDVVRWEDLTSDETVIKLLTRFNTNMIHFEDHIVEFSTTQLEHSPVPNHYKSNTFPIRPLLGGYGKLIEYKVRKFNGYKWSILTVDAINDNLINDYTPFYSRDLVNPNRQPNDIYRLSSCTELNIDILKMVGR